MPDLTPDAQHLAELFRQLADELTAVRNWHHTDLGPDELDLLETQIQRLYNFCYEFAGQALQTAPPALSANLAPLTDLTSRAHAALKRVSHAKQALDIATAASNLIQAITTGTDAQLPDAASALSQATNDPHGIVFLSEKVLPQSEPEYKNIASQAAPGPIGSTPPSRSPSSERHINFWIDDARDAPKLLKVGETYTGNYQVGKAISGSLTSGQSAAIPKSDIPPGGLSMNWTIIPISVTLSAMDNTVSVDADGSASFTLLIPESGDSQIAQLHLTPLADDAALLILLHTFGRLYRRLQVNLAAQHVASDVAITRASDTALMTTHEWTTPPGELTLLVLQPGRANVLGTGGQGRYYSGQTVSIGTDKSLLSAPVDSLRAAAEAFRKQWTQYLNDIDPDHLLQQLANFVPADDWSNLKASADAVHNTNWNSAASSSEMRDLAFYGRRLYDTLFPPARDSRKLLDSLQPGHRINITWVQDSAAGWIAHLPWAFLYTGDVDGVAPVDPTKFWGLRYRIDHFAYDPPEPPSPALGRPKDSCCTSLLFFGNSAREPAFGESEWQRKVWTSWNTTSLARLVPAESALQAKQELVKALQGSAGPSDSTAVLYLFCHYGIDASGKPLLRFGLDASDENSVLRERDLGTSPFGTSPLVFANACATAGASVYSTNTIMKAFFDRGCAAFIGSDCMVPATMASRFAVVFFSFFLRLVDSDHDPMAAGEALTQARLFFWRYYRNIGGLFYSYLNQYDLYMADPEEIARLRQR